MTTRIYLDVDGVFNALPFKGDDLTDIGWDVWTNRKIYGYNITWSPELVAAINEISAREDVEIVWLTTWCEYAQSEIAPNLGLLSDDWRVLGVQAEVDPYTRPWWKFLKLEKDLQEFPVDKIVWVDDDLSAYYPSLRNWHLGRTTDNTMLVRPWTEEGLRPDHIADIKDFLDRV